MANKKLIGWGAGSMLELYLTNTTDHNISYCVDISPKLHGMAVEGVPILSPDALEEESKEDVMVIIFAISSPSIQAIHNSLSEKGYVLGDNYIDFAEFVKDDFKAKAECVFNKKFSCENYVFARSFNLNSQIPLETTVLGNWLLLEALDATSYLEGAIAEVGTYKGGNAYLMLSAMTMWKDFRRYYIFDSFKGFSELSNNDPVNLQSSYDIDYHANRIFNSFRLFENALIVPGFVPETFRDIESDQKFSLVFYDCDLYQPALDTYAFFWDRMQLGGILVIHDNVATCDGWKGVRKATEEYFNPRNIRFYDLWETTMSVIFK